MTAHTYKEAYKIAMAAGQDAGNKYAGGTSWDAKAVDISVQVFHTVIKALGYKLPQ